ncbi:efflux RND transporter periplasmic adaptor subunit [Rhizocola hellebori]|nr:efflux RND transporter periplasmic adaptor subunit [Rhizocola hellebori]
MTGRQVLTRLRSMRNRTTVINIVLAVLLAAGIVAAYFMVTGGQSEANAGTGNVRTVAVSVGTVTATVATDGTIESAATMAADFATAGTVNAINVKIGDLVTAGQVLATVDPTDVKAELDAAKRNLNSAEDALDRATGDAVNNAKNQVDQAETTVAAAQRKVDGTQLKAPMAGTVVALNGTVGGKSTATGSASSGTANFLQIADLTKLQVKATLPEADATRIKPGQVGAVTWNALSSARAKATVTTLSPTPSSGNVITYPLTATLDTVPEGARLGQSVRLTITVDEVADAINVPTAAVTSVAGRNIVTVVANGKQEVRAVQIGLKGDSATVILEGLQAGEQVVLATVSSSTTGGGFQLPGGQLPGGQLPGGQVPGGGTRGGGGNR